MHKAKTCCYTNMPLLVLPSNKISQLFLSRTSLKYNKFAENLSILFGEQFQICHKFKEAWLGHNHFVLSWIQHTLCKMYCINYIHRQ